MSNKKNVKTVEEMKKNIATKSAGAPGLRVVKPKKNKLTEINGL
jgi:hypothetical protein